MDKKEIITSYSKSDFADFLEKDRSKMVLDLFDEEGVNILKQSKIKEEKICYILTFSPYKNELLQNATFLDMFLNTDITSYYAVLRNIDYETCDVIIKRSVELEKEPKLIATLFSYFNINYKLKALDNFPYSKEILYCILKKDEAPVIQKIIDNYDVNLLSHDINLRSFFEVAKNSVLRAVEKRNTDNLIIPEINIPSRMITKEMAEKLWKEYDIFQVRAIINDAAYCADVSVLNNYIKKREEEIIKSYNNEVLLSPFKELYEAFKKFKEEEIKRENNTIDDSDNYYNYRSLLLKIINKLDDDELYFKLNDLFIDNGLESVFYYLKELSNNNLSNYIIDYLFEENYHNIMFDIRELLNFYYQGNIVLPKERVEFYAKISNIDYLSVEERIEIYLYLKEFNMIEIFYDDMKTARYIVAEAIKEYSLSKEMLTKYKDEKLSKEYGLDVYVMDGNPFFGIVKTGRHPKDLLPTGHSYSLVGNGAVAVFGNVKDSRTYLYDADDMNPDQLVHAFPYDSYTYYHPFRYSQSPTRRVNTLLMPEELVSLSSSYTELLILEEGNKKTDLDKYIPELKRIALYCLDEIRKQDVDAAKANDVGIILVDSSKYKQKEYKSSKSYHHNIDEWEYNYFDGFYEKNKFESRR